MYVYVMRLVSFINYIVHESRTYSLVSSFIRNCININVYVRFAYIKSSVYNKIKHV